jgi:hypothetical protein
MLLNTCLNFKKKIIKENQEKNVSKDKWYDKHGFKTRAFFIFKLFLLFDKRKKIKKKIRED